MTISLARLAQTPIDATEEVVYQVPADTDTLVTQLMLCNTSASSVTVHVSVTASGASSTTSADRIFNAFSVAANETVMVMTSLPLSSQEKIWAHASSDDVVNLILSGVVTSTA